MKISIYLAGFGLLALAAGAATVRAQADGTAAVPQDFPANHYAKLIQRSPFAPATPDAPDAEATPDFAANLYVSGLAKVGKQDCVFIASRNQQEKYALFSGEPGPNGLSLVSISWSDDLGKSRVKIRKGSQEATIQFDEAVMKSAPPVAAAEQNDGNQQRIFPPRMPGNNRWGGGNRLNGAAGGNENGGGRRRVRIINND
jgi:hypothetical protein